MKEIAAQVKKLGKNRHILEPFSIEDDEILDEYSENQLVKVQIHGFKKPRSIKELGLFMACCQLVADNSDDQRWNTKEKVVFGVQVSLHFVDPSLVAVANDGSVIFKYLSLAFVNLEQARAHRFFDRGFDILAQKLGVSVETLISEAQARMKRRAGAKR